MKILAVCAFGVGSSMILKMSIESVLAMMGKSAEVENTDLATAPSLTCDFILTSPLLLDNLKSSVKVPVYAVTKYIDKEEIKGVLEQHFASINK